MLQKPQIRSCTIEELYAVPTLTQPSSMKAAHSPTPTLSLKASTLPPTINHSSATANSAAALTTAPVVHDSFVQKNAVLISIAAIAAIGVGIYLYQWHQRERQRNHEALASR